MNNEIFDIEITLDNLDNSQNQLIGNLNINQKSNMPGDKLLHSVRSPTNKNIINNFNQSNDFEI